MQNRPHLPVATWRPIVSRSRRGAGALHGLHPVQLLSIGLALGLLLSVSTESRGHVFYHENVLGTSLELHVESPSLSSDRKAEAAVLREIDRLSGILSTYSKASEVSAFLHGPDTPRKASAELLEVLRACDHWKAVSGGAFNPAAEIFSRLWNESAGQNRLPSEAELEEAVRRARGEPWEIDAAAQTVARRSDAPLSLNAIAKGYIIEQACRAALASTSGVTGLVLDIGGDLRVCGDGAKLIGIADPTSPYENAPPLCCVEVRDGAVATSGNYERGFEINGVHYSHILDPRSGRPVSHVVSATVIAPEAAEADVLATILNVLEPGEGVGLVNRLEKTECLIVTEGGEILKSSGWDRFSQPVPPVAFEPGDGAAESEAAARQPAEGPRRGISLLAGFQATPEAAGEPDAPQEEPPQEAAEEFFWGKEFEFVVDFEIKRAGWYRYARPYVAVWIEDAEGKPVRTLCLWASDFQWLPDLRRWYYLHRSDRRLIYAMSRATRPPGRYRIIWDGRANNAEFVPAAQYIVCIEAVREHGTYQLIRQRVNIGNEPFTGDIKGNYEISRASVEYRQKKSSEAGGQKSGT